MVDVCEIRGNSDHASSGMWRLIFGVAVLIDKLFLLGATGLLRKSAHVIWRQHLTRLEDDVLHLEIHRLKVQMDVDIAA